MAPDKLTASKMTWQGNRGTEAAGAHDRNLCVCGHIRLDHQDMNVEREKLDRCWGGNCSCRGFKEART